MRVFLYEFITGGGWYSCGDEPCAGSLIREARAMVAAIGSDLCAVEGVELVRLHDSRQAAIDCGGETIAVASRFEELLAVRRAAASCDWTIVIAPEFGGLLAQRAAIVEKSSGRLLGPSMQTIRLTSDKHQTAEHLLRLGVAAPIGVSVEPKGSLPDEFDYPAVLKPRDGAGSQNVRLIHSADDAIAIIEPSRLERFVPGLAASVAFLCGPDRCIALPACRQRLSTDGTFQYLGGELPLSPELDRRARMLASAAVSTLDGLLGYLGVDLVLGDAEDGSDDYVIEINPRLTTSYVGLRAAADVNLAEAMLSLASGDEPHVQFSNRAIQFDAAGNVDQAF